MDGSLRKQRPTISSNTSAKPNETSFSKSSEARKGELVTGIVRRYERDRDNVILELGKAEAILRKRNQIRKETYRPGDSIQAYLLEINHNSRGPNIELSRTHEGLIVKLFELGVPEIRQGLVEIKSCARVPGERAKIAVHSDAPDVDPVGACVGLRGSRVQEVVRSLNGEAIDIVSWSPDPSNMLVARLLLRQWFEVVSFRKGLKKVNARV